MSKLDKLIPLQRAAKQLGLTVGELTRLAESGIIKGSITSKGVILIPKSQLDKIITREQFKKLRGKPITVHEAVEKYGISDVTISKWARLGYIEIIKPGYGMTIDACDMAYCAAVYKSRGGQRGARIFDESGNPYELKRPEVAEYRRKRKIELEQTTSA